MSSIASGKIKKVGLGTYKCEGVGAQGSCTGKVELFKDDLKGGALFGVGRYDNDDIKYIIGNDKASSIRVPPGCVAEVYEHEFTGSKSVFGAGTYDTAAYTKKARNDDASSLVVKSAADVPPTTWLMFGDIKLISNPCGTKEATAPSRFFTAPSTTWPSWVQPLGGLASLQAPGKMRSVMDSCADGNLNCTFPNFAFPNFKNCRFQETGTSIARELKLTVILLARAYIAALLTTRGGRDGADQERRGTQVVHSFSSRGCHEHTRFRQDSAMDDG